MKTLYISISLLFALTLFSINKSYAQITTNAITFNPICPGSIIPVTFNSPGTWFSSTENVVIELSNSSGSFATGTTVIHNGTYVSAGWFIVYYAVPYTATVNVTIPLTTTPGSSYRIRTYSDINTATGNNGSNLTINPTAVAGTPGGFTTGPTSICQNNNATYTVGTVAGAVSYQWSYTGSGVTFSGTGNSVTATFSPSATAGDITVYSVNANGCLSNNSRTRTVTINLTPTQPLAFTTSTIAVCAPQSGVTYTVPAVAGATSYEWSYSGSGASISGTSNNVSINFSALATSGTLSVTATNACGTSAPRTLGITIGTAPAQPAAFTMSTAEICAPVNNVIYTIAPVTGAASYTWTYSGSGATISGATTNSVSINFSSGASDGNLSVTANFGSCKSSPLTMAVNTSSGRPGRPGNITNTITACQGETGVNVSCGTSSGATTYTWTYDGTGATINGNSNNITIDFAPNATSGTLTVRGTNGCGNSTNTRTRNITISPAAPQPSIITTNNTSPCVTSTGITYTVANVASTLYTWTYSGSGAVITSGATSRTITVKYTGATNGTWTVTPNNGSCDGPSRNLAVTLQNPGNWLGAVNSSWINSSNWSCGALPTASNDLVIAASAPNMPNVNGAATVRNLTINPGAYITNNGTLNVYGNFVNSGKYLDYSTTAFVGSTAQTYSGTPTDSLNNLTLNNATGLSITTPLYVKQYLSLTNGNLASAGNLTVDIYYGAILGAGSGTVSGNITVVRTIWKDKWHYIASPLSGKTFADIDDDVIIKFGSKANLYLYDETVINADREVGWSKINTVTSNFESMKGYALYFPLWKYNTQIDFTGTYNHNASYSNATLSNSPSSNPAADGWNLVGNPYPSEIDWNAASGWTKTGLDNAIYFWDQANNRYAYYAAGIGTNGGSRYIPCMQAFYVKVTNPGTGTLGMTKNIRSSVQNRDNWRVGSEEKRLQLKATSGEYNDEAYIRFSEDATLNFDSQLDAYKLPNGGNSPSLSTKIANETYAINSLPNNLTDKVIPIVLGVNVSGMYTLDATTTAFEDADNIVLEDRLLNIFQDLKNAPSYSANLEKGDTTTRFFIHYKREKTPDVLTSTNNSAITNKNVSVFAFKQNITVDFNNVKVSEANIAVFDAIGNKVYELKNATIDAGKIELNLTNANTGIYIVKIASNAGVTNQQVYISR